MPSNCLRSLSYFLLTCIVPVFYGLQPSIALAQSANTSKSTFSFAVMGDQPYSEFFESATANLINHMNQDPEVAFIIHVGDIKGGSEPCSDELIRKRLAQLERSSKPVVYLFGDNEWTDCHRFSNGNYDSQERLKFLRHEMFAGTLRFNATALAPIRQTQEGFPEHWMWEYGDTLFVGLNVPGSNNDLENPSSRKLRSEEVEALYNKRQKACEAWLAKAQERLRQPHLRSWVVAFQGNPIDGSSAGLSINRLLGKKDGYRDLMLSLTRSLQELGKPLLLIHGDTHRYRFDSPNLADYQNADDGSKSNPNVQGLFKRLEAWGHPFTNQWVKVTVAESIRISDQSNKTNPHASASASEAFLARSVSIQDQ